MRMTTKSVMCR